MTNVNDSDFSFFFLLPLCRKNHLRRALLLFLFLRGKRDKTGASSTVTIKYCDIASFDVTHDSLGRRLSHVGLGVPPRGERARERKPLCSRFQLITFQAPAHWEDETLPEQKFHKAS